MYITIVFLAFALATDAFAVSVVNSICFTNITKRHAILASFLFGLFQGAMPIIGFLVGTTFIDIISAFDHWVAFILLSIIGGKMLYECKVSWNNKPECPTVSYPGTRLLITQAFATSIDALVVGISLAAIGSNIIVSALIIAVITFICCLVGHFLGKKLGGVFSNWAHLIGALMLIGIGLNILLEHLFS